MTAMTYANQTFDVVVDKGSLDALMSEDTPLAAQQANTMFAEIVRVLNGSGIYIVVSLGQEHILKALFTYFNHGFSIDVSIVDELRTNPLVPYIFTVFKSTTRSDLRLFFDCMGSNLVEGRTVHRSEATLQVTVVFNARISVTYYCIIR